MKALIDTCVIIDALQNREPFSKAAQEIFLLCANHIVDGYISAKSVTDIYYITHRHTHNDKRTRKIISDINIIFNIADTLNEDIINALASDISDFEDAVMVATAIRDGFDCIVTRNKKDYSAASLPVYEPEEFIALVHESEQDF